MHACVCVCMSHLPPLSRSLLPLPPFFFVNLGVVVDDVLVQGAFDRKAHDLTDGVDAAEAYFAFLEKAMKLQQSFAEGLESLCASRHAQTARLFNSSPAEHNPCV